MATNSAPQIGSPDGAGSDAAMRADGTSPEPDAADAAIDSRAVSDTIAEPAVDANAVTDASTLIDASTPGDAANEADAGGSPCTDANACRTFSNYCGGCTCQAMSTGEPDPACEAGTTSCLLDPCRSHTAVCDPNGRCTLR